MKGSRAYYRFMFTNTILVLSTSYALEWRSDTWGVFSVFIAVIAAIFAVRFSFPIIEALEAKEKSEDAKKRDVKPGEIVSLPSECSCCLSEAQLDTNLELIKFHYEQMLRLSNPIFIVKGTQTMTLKDAIASGKPFVHQSWPDDFTGYKLENSLQQNGTDEIFITTPRSGWVHRVNLEMEGWETKEEQG